MSPREFRVRFELKPIFHLNASYVEGIRTHSSQRNGRTTYCKFPKRSCPGNMFSIPHVSHSDPHSQRYSSVELSKIFNSRVRGAGRQISSRSYASTFMPQRFFESPFNCSERFQNSPSPPLPVMPTGRDVNC